MHTARELDQALFSVRIGGQAATRDDLFPDWQADDRLGVVIAEPFGAVGATHLVQLAITAFYDARPRRRLGTPDGVEAEQPTAVYPDFYLFHVGGKHGDHTMLDIWPARKEVFLPAHPRLVLDAINDRGITRLAVPDGPSVPVKHEFKEPAFARDRIREAFVYSPSGRVEGPEIELTGLDPATEANARVILDPDLRARLGEEVEAERGIDPDPELRARSWPAVTAARLTEASAGLGLANSRRAALRREGDVRETYRRTSVDAALGMLSPASRRPGSRCCR
ncbi:MAG: hypothetical protein JSS97_01285 [Actinobacteria bacterium]|nr:hypothetical protein [Actinomycetota bacterium]